MDSPSSSATSVDTTHHALDISDIIDLHELVALVMYEWGTTEPRFRHTQLREVATTRFKTISAHYIAEWNQVPPSRRLGFVFDRPNGQRYSDWKKESVVRGLPTNMLSPNPIPTSLRDLPEKQLETYYWQARAHDGCHGTILILQHFFNLFPSNHRPDVRVRTLPPRSDPTGQPVDYTTRFIIPKVYNLSLYDSGITTVSCILPNSNLLITGHSGMTTHVVLGFGKPGGPTLSILDMSSLQYGEAGRGHWGKNFFILEPIEDYAQYYLPMFAKHNNFCEAPITPGVRGVPRDVNEYLMDVARRVKDRWDNRRKVPFCAYCGGPSKLGEKMLKCPVCKETHYCCRAHQDNAGSYHKLFCPTSKTPQ